VRANELIVQTLREEGLDAATEGGWVYITLSDGRVLEIACEYGQSLDATVYRTDNA
jgi:hypothetical protein